MFVNFCNEMFTFCFRLFGSGGSCAACGQNIPAHEMVMRVHGSTYHLKCFTCAACNTQLTPGNRYAIINGNIVCEQDYPKVTKGQINGNSRNSSKIHGMMTKIWKLRKTSDFTILPSLNSNHFVVPNGYMAKTCSVSESVHVSDTRSRCQWLLT